MSGQMQRALDAKAQEYYQKLHRSFAEHVDRMMVYLLPLEWLGAVCAALILSPKTWSGNVWHLHPHVWTALLFGPAIVALPVALGILRRGDVITRHVIAASQILMSVLLIDVTGGRIETHFHVFGSLAFLAFYRDWRVLVTASAVTAVDHIVRGIWWPQSVYGVLTVSPWRWVEHAWWVIFEDIFLTISSFRSLTEMLRIAVRETQLSYGANHDVLTGLANRRLLSDRFDHILGKGEPGQAGAVLFIDLDRFKQVNDTLGHGIGDKLLEQVAERLAGVLQANDSIARVGGDEFVVLLDGKGRAPEAARVGERLLAALNQTFETDNHPIVLSGSVGISFYPEHGRTLEELQSAADHAMYEAKAQGRNRCEIFSHELLAREQMRNQLERDLYRAIPRGELEVYFQPQVDGNHAIRGFEALLRWNHPVHRRISPAEFIPIAEKTALIVSLGEWVLREACKACKRWQEGDGAGITVAVNVSALEIERPDFVESVLRMLRETDLDPPLLTLELTESVVMKNLDQTSAALHKLRSEGVRIALDDFGTGYSSLSYLQVLPADKVKLDRGFVSRGFEDSPNMVASVIEMAHRVGLDVVAEGVETSSQCAELRRLSCDEIQGFFYSPAVSAEEALEMLAGQCGAGVSACSLQN